MNINNNLRDTIIDQTDISSAVDVVIKSDDEIYQVMYNIINSLTKLLEEPNNNDMKKSILRDIYVVNGMISVRNLSMAIVSRKNQQSDAESYQFKQLDNPFNIDLGDKYG